ncbi:MAG: RNA polymerase sigma factor, partial [Actinomycetota bacterium]
MERPDDRELVDRYAGGDPRAFDEIVERYERRVYAVALRMTGNPDDARDAVQETFISAL